MDGESVKEDEVRWFYPCCALNLPYLKTILAHVRFIKKLLMAVRLAFGGFPGFSPLEMQMQVYILLVLFVFSMPVTGYYYEGGAAGEAAGAAGVGGGYIYQQHYIYPGYVNGR
ncbi:hypothetical protein AVEN_140964-1 [Araneus ventricosus]|uniref:Uncharacterized protein n=1 Tax=Araneus ventricosus TaxID=182803 RepID=A0A4Y2LMC0_ARAVE|nr:hypothetical protein AVEN_140964-1 [Araneus ventricosus]